MAAALYVPSVGRRKSSTAVVKLFPKGSGKMFIKIDDNLVDLREYFGGHDYMIEDILYPFDVIGSNNRKEFDIEVKAAGGGLMGQAGAIRLGIARGLVKHNEERRKILKPYGLLKRDPRIKERKKPGLKKARKRPQWSKR